MPLDRKVQEYAAQVAELVHAEQPAEAARYVAELCKLKLKLDGDNPAKYLPVLQNWLHFLLNNDGTVEAAQLLWTPTQFDPRPQYTRNVWKLYDECSMGLIQGGASCSKCLGPEELCRLWGSHETKSAKDIVCGDQLLGDDGRSRTVLSTTSGRGEMYRVSTKYGDSFTCNADHILTVICAENKYNSGGKGNVSSGYIKGTVIDVPVREFLRWSATRREHYALFYAPVSMPARPVQVDPYIYGSWLGDGTGIRAELTTPDGPMLREWYRYWKAEGFTFYTVNKRGCLTVKVTGGEKSNRARWQHRWFQESVVAGEKRIRNEYLRNSEKSRLQLLAGVIDADGTIRSGGYDVTTKWSGLADDLVELARSLGFPTTRAVRKHSIKSTGFSALYHHVSIWGNIARIPTLEKRATRTRGIVKGRATAKLRIESLGMGEYSGFSLDGNHRFVLGNGLVTHNSFGMGVRLFLEYVRDPEFTAIKVVGPSKEHLEANLFSALVGLHGSASLPMPGKVGQLFIGMTRRDQLGSIRGVTIPVGQTKKAGRIQGTKRKPRSQPHPIFGPLSRLFVFMDEVENIPGGIWSDVDNILSQVDAEGVAGFKILAAWNPRDLTHEVAKRAEPEFGWEGVEADTHYRWKSRRGWEVLRLDGEQSENVKQNRTVYPGLQTRAGLEIIAKNGGGRDSAGYDTMGRGMYPKRGMVTSIIPLGMFRSWRGIFIWQEAPRAVASCDLALDGGAAALFTLGKMGRASGMKLTPTLEHPLGRTIMFKNLRGQPQSRLGLQADQQFAVPKGDSVEMAERIVVLNKRAGVKPEFFACDRTGHGAGTADLIKHNWGVGIHDVNYSDGASKTKLMEESTKTCAEEYDRACSELWYALRAYGEYGYLLINPELDASKLQGQVTERLSKTSGKKSHVESKKDYMSRGNLSPDDADSLTLFVHAARKGSGIILSQMPESSDGYSGDDGDGEWYDGFVALKGGTHIDPSNRTDTL